MTEEDYPQPPIQLEPSDLSADALRGLVEEFVTRSGTDYGEVERSTDEKIADVMVQLERGDVRIVFDPQTESANLVTARDLD